MRRAHAKSGGVSKRTIRHILEEERRFVDVVHATDDYVMVYRSKNETEVVSWEGVVIGW